MYNKDSLILFKEELYNRQNELKSACTSSNVELESFAQACIEILLESGMFVDEPELLMIADTGYRLDSICWPEEDLPIVEFITFLHGVSDDKAQEEIITIFEKNLAILKLLCKITGRKAAPDIIEQLIHRIHALIPNPDSIIVRIITDSNIDNPNLEKKLNNSLKNRLAAADIHTEFKLCDIKSLAQITDGGTQGPSKEFPENGPDAVRCFLVHDMLDHDVYLAAFSGKTLASAFKDHGQRLLQKNVRAFLGMKGKKNKKIEETIFQYPHRFLAYNNGLTITVSGITVNENNNLIKVEDMQVVNGGQTIAVLANSFKVNDPKCLSDVMVTAKIIHVKNHNEHMRWIERIAETSNTQNAIKDADLSSHNPIYVKIKELSKTTIFRKGIEQHRWYFNRVRNEYKAEFDHHKKQSHTARKNFEITFPQEYVIEKGLIARISCIFTQKPWMASRGEAKCHLDFIANLPDNFSPDVEWYRNLIGKILLIKHMEDIAKKVGIREGRSCIVEYACAQFSYETDFNIYIEKIQRMQSVPEAYDNKLREYIVKTNDQFTKLENNRSTKEHAKREETWNKIREALKNEFGF